MAEKHFRIIPVTVVVSGGVGTGTFVYTGEINDVYLPLGAGTVDWLITNRVAGVDVPRCGEGGVSGNRNYDAQRKPCQGTNTITFINATDGTYVPVIYIVRGFFLDS